MSSKSLKYRHFLRRSAPAIVTLWTVSLVLGWLLPCCNSHAATNEDVAAYHDAVTDPHDCHGTDTPNDPSLHKERSDNDDTDCCCGEELALLPSTCNAPVCAGNSEAVTSYKTKIDPDKSAPEPAYLPAPWPDTELIARRTAVPPAWVICDFSTPHIYLLTLRLRD